MTRIPRRHTSLFIALTLVAFLQGTSAQDVASTSPWMFLPEGGPLLQLHQNPEEPRTGVRKEIGSSRLRLDVGTNLDILQFSPSAADDFRLGFQIFAYALTTSNQGLRLQIDALDGFFGGHITYRRRSGDLSLLSRLRILHRSAHFVDGHIDPATGSWIQGRAPVPFTKDFGELLAAIDAGLLSGHIRIYGAITYATLLRPTEIGRVGGMFGVDYRTQDSVMHAFGHPFLLYAGYQLNLSSLFGAIVGTNGVEAGMKFGRWGGNGVRLFLAYHDGLEVFGQYYDIRRDFWEIGFALDLL